MPYLDIDSLICLNVFVACETFSSSSHPFFLFVFLLLKLNIFLTLSENSYERPHPDSEKALFRLVQEHIADYDSVSITSTDEHATSTRFKKLEVDILKNWIEKVRSSIFGDDKDEL